MSIQTPKPGAPLVDGRSEPMHRDWLRWFRVELLDKVQERLHATTVQTADYDAQVWDLVLCDPSGGGFAVNLPARCRTGDEIAVKNASGSGNAITITPPATVTVDGGATLNLAAAWGGRRLVFDVATGWHVVGRF